MSRRRDIDPDGGFVLLEAVVALAVASLVILLMVTVGGLAAQTLGKGQARAEMLDALEAGTREVRRHIESFAPIPDFARPSGVMFEGGPLRMEFAAPAAASLLDRRHAVVQLAVVDGANGAALVRSTRALPDGMSKGDWAEPVILLQGPWEMRFFYAAPSGVEWLDAWSGAAGLPDRIRLEIVDAVSGERVMPPVIVALHARAVLTCEQVAGTCKATDAGRRQPS